MTMCSPFRRRWAMTEAARPRMRPETSMTVPEGAAGAGLGGAGFTEGAGFAGRATAGVAGRAGFGARGAAAFFGAGAAGAEGPDNGAAGGAEGACVSAKDPHPRSLRLRLQELVDRDGPAAGAVDLGAGRLGVMERGDGEGFRETARGEELAGDNDGLVRLGEAVQVADVDRGCWWRERASFSATSPQMGAWWAFAALRSSMSVRASSGFSLRIVRSMRAALDPGASYKHCRAPTAPSPPDVVPGSVRRPAAPHRRDGSSAASACR